MLSTSEHIGKLDRRITIQRKVLGSDASNQRKITGWTDIATYPEVWANVDEKSGSEVFQADQLVGLTVANFTIRYRTDVTIENRIVYNSKYYDIQAILDVGRKRFLRLTCESGGQYKETTT